MCYRTTIKMANRNVHKVLQRKDFLTLLAKSKKPKQRKLLMEWAEKTDINAISECAFNVLRGNVPLTAKQRKKLGKFKRTLRTLCNKKTSDRIKKREIVQHGGFLPFLIPLALHAATSIIPNIIKKIRGRKR